MGVLKLLDLLLEELSEELAEFINDQSVRMMTPRGLFDLKPAGPPVPVDEVEPAEELFSSSLLLSPDCPQACSTVPKRGMLLVAQKRFSFLLATFNCARCLLHYA